MNLKGRHILITGAAKRIGRALALSLATEKARLTVHYQTSREDAERVCQRAKQSGSDAIYIQADLAKLSQITQAVGDAVNHFGPVEILINSASIFHPSDALTVTVEEWDRFQDINVRGQYLFAREVAKHLLPTRGQGVILNLADVHGERPVRKFLPYTISKAGLLLMTRALAKEWGPDIRVNSISPGAVLLPDHYTEEEKLRSIDRSLLGRLGTPEDIVNAARFLIENDYITGFDLKVDGGRSLV